MMRRALLALGAVCFGILVAGNSRCARAEGGDAATDPAKAGPDFVVQGEYQGEVKLEGKLTKVGAHAVALGDGQFDGVMYVGGLPGDGWKRGDKKIAGKGKTENGVTKFVDDKRTMTGTLVDGKVTVTDSGGQVIGSLKKVERKSPTLGAKPPAGATVLFDGSNLDHFSGASMTEDKLLKAGVLGKDELTDFSLHIEFRTPFMPKARGQGRGNSGVYLQNRYEVQVLDSFGLEGESNECGGIYSIGRPAVNMCYPPLSWQTYDVEFTGARFEGEKKVKNALATIKHNGVVIHDGELPQITPGGASAEFPGRGPLQLQQHGNPVVFRNIWIVVKK